MLQNASEPMIKAYSYIRMSTERQLSGDSLRRQLELSRKYAADNNLLLDESLKDIGVSAYSGANVEVGALGKFLEMVRDGRIEAGSYLIVESLDRLSRKRVLDALPPFIDLLKAGIIVVTLADNQVYSIESVGDNWTQLIMSLSIMARAHEESQRKSDRIKAAIKAKREAALNGDGRYNFNLPKWIDAQKTGDGIRYVLNDHQHVGFRAELSRLGA
ncbi:recombinase family protein [Ensifer sp. SL37]|uniref:recombinase family protein n=1 Tax=Ensifer sp. SL37 TaxID=2995137 RepID=UPI00227329E0|nr:recombinase family protein [Ensifer sp. SL37]MCY1741426.1 recombinase family protein [Ensifer sp. SL37]